MAYITKVKGGWRAQVERHGIRDSCTRETKAEATLWAAAREAEILAVHRGAIPRKTFREALERYGDEVSSTKKGGAFEVKRIGAFLRDFAKLGARQLATVSSLDLAEWRDARLNVVSKGSVQRDINLLSHVFTVARDEWKWVRENPFVGFRAPGDNPPRQRRIQPLEVRLLLRHLGFRTGQRPGNKSAEVALAFLISLRTGMRAGEVLALHKSKLDIKHRLASVPHKMEHVTGRPRLVPLSKHAVRLLRPFQGGFQWSVTSASLDALFRKARDQLLIHDLHFHDARADALTRFARKVDVMQLAKISGHKDLRILLETYYRITPAEIAANLDAPRPGRLLRPSGATSASD